MLEQSNDIIKTCRAYLDELDGMAEVQASGIRLSRFHDLIQCLEESQSALRGAAHHIDSQKEPPHEHHPQA